MFVQLSSTSFILIRSIIRFSLVGGNIKVLFLTLNTGEILEVRENAEIVFNNLYSQSTTLLLDGSIRLSDN